MAAVLTPQKGAGCLMTVVGPSGVGKDTLIAEAQKALGDRPDIFFVRRTITRPADAGGEEHDAVDEATFRQQLAAGAFAVAWRAHELSYGIPSQARDHVAAGGLAIVNGSRHALPHIAAAFPVLHVVEITADSAILARRLASRGRESAEMIEARLGRTPPSAAIGQPTTVIDNSGDLSVATERLLALISSLRPAC
ncbi:phosphonate metabolism protein/1,5-bisphosphokinase (PRPP-forming) PhnN [Notoacmeibacter sp. MSK16QG-6]|uniref:phosphonate metabolism protein/1,5-bisphosphokinase (PRPP-forming) PhnN n=1 Tax=Notoacmeibacter sp. MSK16QG-6 TaxID=2957982 RepID=UPI00209D148F|nr:phosphonate metabolism protein/1,5-bisphosphokinase (PRPP-forming) PhnN [Notoacmeibacter sp. MSK16QG-6]MCP1201133.1 phosphonate metabolism protein/1,5-bisphosphokinase (PRPP-forming) PhnN [Notoacmeibacter sp. MSK16QG-6]